MACVDVDTDAGQLLWLANDAQAVTASVVTWNAECVRRLDHAQAFARIAAGRGRGR